MAYFNNYALFSKNDKQIHITVDYGKEYFSMKPLIEEYTGKNPDDESYTVDADLPEYIEENKKQKEAFASKFQIDFEEAEYRENQYLWGKKLPKLPFNKHPRVKRVVFHMRAKPYNHRDT